MRTDPLPWFDKGELLRFAVSGGTSALVYLGVLFAAKTFLSLLAASVAGYAMAMVVNYLMQRRWTFKSDRAHVQTVPRFVVTHLGGIAINAAILHALVEAWALPILPSQFLAFAAIAAWSYLLQKLWVFGQLRQL